MIFVLYDGVDSTVFQSQVLVPLLKHLHECPKQTVTLVSFERGRIASETLMRLQTLHDRLKLVVLKKYPMIGRVSLWVSLVSFVRLLNTMPVSRIVSRGPFAGWIVCHALPFLKWGPPSCVVQARGVAAEEYRYGHEIHHWFHAFKYRLYKRIETDVYAENIGFKGVDFSIEAVSDALRTYLIDSFGADPGATAVSEYDVPESIDSAQVQRWRKEVRLELGISLDADVTCYVGSAHPWQCVDEMVAFVKKKSTEDPDAYFLFLTNAVDTFERKLSDAGLLRERYLVLFVAHNQIYRYLSAADAGLLFRDKDIVNWVSRPTKVLEYRAVGLRIVHNGTVAFLSE